MNFHNKKALGQSRFKCLFYLVAGARSDLALGHNTSLRKDKMVAGVHNHLNLLFSAIGLSERNITI